MSNVWSWRFTRGLLGLLLVLLLALVGLAPAGDYHSGANLHCTDCHIMHASKDGVTYNGGDGFDKLLKGTKNEVCMQCHDGSDTTAPDIVAAGTAATPNDNLGISYSSQYKNSAGYFQSDWSSQQANIAHDLYATGQLTAIQGTWTSSASGMTCMDCHDAHGTANFRNLLLKPGTAGTNVNVRSGQEVHLREAITIPATASATATHYDTSAVAFDDPNNIVNWCISCHTNITSSSDTKHPQNVTIKSASAGTNWDDGTNGFGTTVGDGTAGIPRVRFAEDGTDYTTCMNVDSNSNKVMCLTCHKAHGSKYDSTVIWPYYEGGADETSACTQCHNKGA